MRDVILKLIRTNSHEYKIHEELLRCSVLFGQECPGVLPPVAILGSSYDFSFIVMPR